MAARVNYTSREFVQILTDLRDNLRSALPDVNDFLESSEGRYLLDMFAAVADMVSFAIDRQGAESFVDTVETRPNLLSLLKLINYWPMNPTPEQVMVDISRGGDVSSPQVIPKYTRLLAASSKRVVPFVTMTQVTIAAGETTTSVACLQGEWHTTSYTSNGAPYQVYLLPSKIIAAGMVRAFVNSVEWTQATDNTFVGHKATDNVFRLVPQADQRMLVEFGNNGEGKIPPIGNVIRIDYLDTLHKNGHINANEIQGLVDNNTGLVANNAAPSTGGLDFEEIESARRRYPLAFKAMRRAVTLGDWEALAGLVPGVMQAKAVDINIDPKMPFYKVKLYVMGNGGFTSDALNETVDAYIRNRRVNSVPFEVLSPEKVLVEVIGTLNVYRSYNSSEVLSDVTTAVSDFFEMTGTDGSEVKLGAGVPLSRLISAIQNVPGVASVSLTSPLSDVTVLYNQFAGLKAASFTVAGVV